MWCHGPNVRSTAFRPPLRSLKPLLRSRPESGRGDLTKLPPARRLGRRSAGGLSFDSSSGETESPFRRDHFRNRSEEHTSELQSLMRISYAVFCFTQKIH